MFTVAVGELVNIIIISIGIGVCGMSILQVSFGARLSKQVTVYFQLFLLRYQDSLTEEDG